MKKAVSLFALCLMVLFLNASSTAGNQPSGNNNGPVTAGPSEASANPYSVEESVLSEKFGKLDNLANEVNQSGATLEDIKANNAELVKDLTLATDVETALAPQKELSNGISFLIGCLLGIIGILIVYLVTDGDKQALKMSLFGMLTWLVVWVLFYIIYVVAIIGAASTV